MFEHTSGCCVAGWLGRWKAFWAVSPKQQDCLLCAKGLHALNETTDMVTLCVTRLLRDSKLKPLSDLLCILMYNLFII